jgi:hypothetical protein
MTKPREEEQGMLFLTPFIREDLVQIDCQNKIGEYVYDVHTKGHSYVVITYIRGDVTKINSFSICLIIIFFFLLNNLKSCHSVKGEGHGCMA